MSQSSTQLPTIRNGWSRFWFTPADPTTLGFMRIVTGLLVLYVHLAYCFDLRNFFGPQSWWDLQAVNQERRSFPYVQQPWNWSELQSNIRPPDTPHRKEAVMNFLRSLPAKQADRRSMLVYLTKYAPSDPIEFVRAMSFIERLPTDDVQRLSKLDRIRTVPPDPEGMNPSPEFPPFLQNLPVEPPEVRKGAGDAAEFFYKALPIEAEPRRYILDWLQELTPDGRQRTLEFIDRLPENETERKALLQYLEQWLVDRGQVYAFGKPAWSLYFHITSPVGMWTVHITTIVFAFLFTIGLWTRFTSVMTWMLVMTYIHRSELVLFGMDTMMNILLIYLMIAPSGHALSVDRLIERKRLWRYHLAKGGPMDPGIADRLANPQRTVLTNFVTRLLQIHFCFIYGSSGVSKLKGDAWWLNDAVWGTLVNPEFSPFLLPGYEQLMYLIASTRPLYAFCMSAGVAFTLVLEIALPCLVWTRMRPYMVIGGVMLHAGIAFFMGLSVFSMFMMTLLLCYLRPQTIRNQLAFDAKQTKVTLSYSKKDAQQVETASNWGAVDTARQVEFIERDGPLEVKVGTESVGSPADRARRAFRELALLKPIAWLSKLPVIGGVLRRPFAA